MVDQDLNEKLLRLRFEEGPHEYFLSMGASERKLVSATQMLSGMGLVDTSMFKQEHLDNGTARHFATELDDLGKLDESSLDSITGPAVEAWRQFIADSKFVNRHIEVRGFSETHGYAFTIDRVGTWGGKSAIVDIKGSSKLRSYPLQLWLYKMGWEELTGERIERLASVHLQTDGRSKVYVYEQDDLAREFAAALPAIYAWKSGNRLLDDEVAESLIAMSNWATHNGNRMRGRKIK